MSTAMTANERLIQSREQLRLALRQVSSSPDADDDEHINGAPSVSALQALARNWWARQPVRVALTLASETASVVLTPVAQRHPYGLVTGAAAVGALLVWVRPWRWICTSALLTGVLPKLITEAVLHMPPPSGQANTKEP